MSTKVVAMRALLAGCIVAAAAALATACDDSAGPGPQPTVSPETEPGVSGVVFEDKNGNGVRDEGERGVEWDLRMCMSDMCLAGTTVGDGRFHFEKVIPGRNSIILANAVTGWQRVVKDCDAGTFTYHEGESKTVDLPIRFVGEHASGYGGSVWKDGAPPSPGARVEALVGDKVCGETTTCGLLESRYSMWVASAEEDEGCGEEGSEVRFRIDGAMANQTAEWHDGDSATIDLFVGPEPAVFGGIVLMYRPGTPNIMVAEGTSVQAYVGDQLWGESTVFTAHPGPNMYQVAVLPEALRAACGTEGAPVRFTIGGEPANEDAVWERGVHRLQLTIGDPPPPTPTPTPRLSLSPSPTQRPGKITPTPTATPVTPQHFEGQTMAFDYPASWHLWSQTVRPVNLGTQERIVISNAPPQPEDKDLPAGAIKIVFEGTGGPRGPMIGLNEAQEVFTAGPEGVQFGLFRDGTTAVWSVIGATSKDSRLYYASAYMNTEEPALEMVRPILETWTLNPLPRSSASPTPRP